MKPLTRLIGYALILALTQPFEGCTQGCRDCSSQPFTEDVRQYFFNFKPGSYWIYKNTLNNDIDSVYFVSQTMEKDAVNGESRECFIDRGSFLWKGFAKTRSFGLVVIADRPELSISFGADVGFYGDRDGSTQETLPINGKLFNTITFTNCCAASSGLKCPSGYPCNTSFFEMMKITFSKDIGMVRWQARRHPVYGDVVYELVRYNIIL